MANRMSTKAAKAVVTKLVNAHMQMHKSVESIGADYYGAIKWYADEEKFWTQNAKLLILVAKRIRDRYGVK